MDLVALFLAAASLVAVLASVVLTFGNDDRSLSKNILAILLILLALLDANGFLYFSGWYLQHPAWHKVLLPLSMLIAPVTYLYFRTTMRGEFRLRRTDAWLLLPAILYGINLIPYYTMPVEDKRAWLTEFYHSSSLRTSDQEGWLPSYIASLFRGVWSLVFLLLNIRLLRSYSGDWKPGTQFQNASVFSWLKQLNFLTGALILVALFGAVIAPLLHTAFNLPNIVLGLSTIVICLNLFLRPHILYGIHNSVEGAGMETVLRDKMAILPEISPDLVEEVKNETAISPIQAGRYKKVVETHFQEQRPYLDAEYSLEKLVRDTGIPRYVLSAFINREYGIGFPEFVNRQRVKYFEENLDNPNWVNYTLDAIGRDCGFSNRVTFFRNVKTITGKTPTQHFRK